MAKNIENTSSASSGSFSGDLSEDLRPIMKKPNQWTQARNAVSNTVKGDIGDLINEASNYLCTSSPYPIIGVIHVGVDEWAIFSTDDENSEIGLFKDGQCHYEKIVNSSCLNFDQNHLIKGVGRKSFDCGRKVYWDDGKNPTRVLDLDDIPWIQSCTDDDGCLICADTSQLDCDKLRLAPKIRDLSFEVKQGNS